MKKQEVDDGEEQQFAQRVASSKPGRQQQLLANFQRARQLRTDIGHERTLGTDITAAAADYSERVFAKLMSVVVVVDCQQLNEES